MLHTTTLEEQREVEEDLDYFFGGPPEVLRTDAHMAFITRATGGTMPAGMAGLDASRCWMVYWTLHAADLMGHTDAIYKRTPREDIAAFLLRCFIKDEDPSHPNSEAGATFAHDGKGSETRFGFGGGPMQCPHLASSYAAVSALVILGLEEPLRALDRAALENWIVSLRQPDGSFRMHRGGEIDVRASFCAAAITTMLSLDAARVLPPQCGAYIGTCQTFEGGIGSCADGGTEAHGGYVQCGAAAALLMKQRHVLDWGALRRWCGQRQLAGDRGFCGRTNKLVDSCYSFWLGSSSAMCSVAGALDHLESQRDLSSRDLFLLDYAQLLDVSALEFDASVLVTPPSMRLPSLPADADLGEDTSDSMAAAVAACVDGDFPFDQRRLQSYVLQAAQNDGTDGGLRDKPSAGCDFYHTCYSLSGLSIAQNNIYMAHARSDKLATVAARPGLMPQHNAHPALAGTPAERAIVFPMGVPSTGAPPAGVKQALRKKAPKADVIPPPVTLRAVNPLLNVCRDRVAWALRTLRGVPFL